MRRTKPKIHTVVRHPVSVCCPRPAAHVQLEARIVAYIRAKLSPSQLQRYGTMEPYALIAWYRHKHDLDFVQLQHEVELACPA